MKNSERKDRIAKITEELSKLSQKRIELYHKAEFYLNGWKSSSSDDDKRKYDAAKQAFDNVNSQYETLFAEMRSLQVKYSVEYEGAIIIDGKMEMPKYKEELFLSTHVDIDTFKNGIDTLILNDPDVTSLLYEIANFIYMCRTSKYNILNVQLSS